MLLGIVGCKTTTTDKQNKTVLSQVSGLHQWPLSWPGPLLQRCLRTVYMEPLPERTEEEGKRGKKGGEKLASAHAKKSAASARLFYQQKIEINK